MHVPALLGFGFFFKLTTQHSFISVAANVRRVENWVAQLIEEGILEGGSASSSAPAAKVAAAAAAPTVTDVEVVSKLEEFSNMLDKSIETHADNGYIPHYNPKTKSTMWTSVDGRTCYYTLDASSTRTSVSP